MEHVVFFPAHDGTPAFRRVASLEEAVRLVEHLRNVESINEVSVHALAEVPLAFKTFIRVEVPGVQEAPTAPAAEVSAPAEDLVVPVLVEDVVPEQPVVALAASNGQAVAGPTSLGFFAS